MGQSNSKQPELTLSRDEPALQIPEDLSSVLGRAYDYDYESSSEDPPEPAPVPVQREVKFKLFINKIWVGTRCAILSETELIRTLVDTARHVWDLEDGKLGLDYRVPLTRAQIYAGALHLMGPGPSHTIRVMYTPACAEERILQHPNFLSDLLNMGRTGDPLYDTVIARRRAELGLALSSSSEPEEAWDSGDEDHAPTISRLADFLQRAAEFKTLCDSLHNPARAEEARLCSLDREAGEGESTCSICLVNTANTVIVPCGHSQFCYSCSLKLGSCGLCTKPIQIRQRMFSD